jgi:CHAT domain-containing protein
VLTRDTLEMVQLGASASIADAALAAQRSLQDIVSTPPAERIARMRALSKLIWAPLRQHLSQPQTLVFVPDMALHYIPFAALLDGAAPDRFLIENRNVATTPSLRMLLAAASGSKSPTDRLLLIADPDYGPDVPRLKGTAREAEAIVALAASGRADRLQGRQATRERFLSARLDSYRYIHVASHALADARLPQLSSLQLASVDEQGNKVDGQVLAADLLNIRLNADLVVLSACETALGRVVSGEGVVGLRYVFLARGAHSVASSLWKVGDRYAQELMTGLYSSLYAQKQPPPAALASAMRAAIRLHGADPAAWAGFELSIRDLDRVL